MHPDIKNINGLYPFSEAQTPTALTDSEEEILGRRDPNHATVFTGYDQPANRSEPIKYKVENSWGMAPGTLGHFHMYPGWFDMYVGSVFIHRSLLTEEERQALDARPKILSPHDDYRSH